MNGRRGQMLRAAVFLCGMLLATAARAEDVSYVLALSWQADFCASDAGSSKAECRTADDNDRLVLHGLWPNADRNGDGRLDAGDDYCMAPAEREQMVARDRSGWRQLPAVTLPEDLRQDLARVMPGVASLLDRHQWIKHGTCSGLTPARYFQAAVVLTDAVAETTLAKLIASKKGQEVARRELLAAFTRDFREGSERAVQFLCRRDDAGAYLSEIRLRLREGSVEMPLTRESLDTRWAPKSSCPARFEIEGQ